jgi:tRNA threonylcarbamoyladenosine biosynthesis protein TsaE
MRSNSSCGDAGRACSGRAEDRDLTHALVLCEAGVDLERLEALSRRLAVALRSGDLVLFYGPLGAGKTTMIRAMARALGVTDPVRSPSFTIANIYAGPLTVNHLDLYRLDEIGEEDALALEEYVSPGSVTLVEWPEAGEGRMGRPTWVVRLGHESMTTRCLSLESADARAVAHWEEACRGEERQLSAPSAEPFPGGSSGGNRSSGGVVR